MADSENLVVDTGTSIPPEDPNDPFDRQRCITGFKHELIEKQTCLLLGSGGLGCTVAFALARLGVGKIILIDRDVVECSNLNRQILFSRSHIGKPKATAAAEGLQAHCIGKTEIEAYQMDVKLEWEKVVQLAKGSTVIFNNVDVGEYYDFAVLQLAKKLEIPCVMGSSYSYSCIVEGYNGDPKGTSFSLVNAANEDLTKKLTLDEIMKHKTLDFVPDDDKPDTRQIGSNVLVCSTTGLMIVNVWCQNLMERKKMPNYIKFGLDDFWEDEGCIAFDV